MTSKYLNPQVPILADGDLMAVVIQAIEEQSTIEYLISEGVDRHEMIYLIHAKRVISHVSFQAEIVEIDETTDLYSMALNFKEASISRGKTGARLIFIDDDVIGGFFQDASLISSLLKLLMKGCLSIARTINLDSDIRGNRFFFHPRIMFKGEVMPNPLFISPSTVGDGEKPFEVFLNQTLNRTSISKGKIHNFPTNLPNLLESILDSVPIGIVAGDTYGNMVFFNKEATRIMGLPASPLPYAERIRRFGNFLPDKITPYPFEELPLSRAIRGEEFEGVPLYINRPELKEGVMVECNGSGMYDIEGVLLGGVVIFQDITVLEIEREEKRKLEGRLLQSQKMESLGLMAGGIAHDFNNLLVGVLGNASVLLQTEAISSPYRKRLMQIQEAGAQLAELTKQLLIYAGLSPAKDLEKGSLAGITKVMSGLLETAVSKKINLSFDRGENSLWILMEPTQLKQVLLNLVVNASDSYKGKDGSILVSTFNVILDEATQSKCLFGQGEVNEEYAVLQVADNGCGMSEDDIRRAFDPFYSSKGVGRGLGLSAVLGIVKNHRGLLEVESMLGHGTSFRLYFPLAEPPEKQEKFLEKEGSAKTGRVLIIDDEKLVLDVADALLMHAGFQPICVNGGYEGLARLDFEQGDVELVIVDLTMPDISGEIVYQRIRSKYPNLPVVISSGFSRETFDVPIGSDSNLYFLEKPYTADKLIGLVRRLCSK